MKPYPIAELNGELGYSSKDLAAALDATNGRILSKFDGHNFKLHEEMKLNPRYVYCESILPPARPMRGGRNIRVVFLNLFATKVLLCHYNSVLSRRLLIDIFNFEKETVGEPDARCHQPQGTPYH